MSDKALSGDCRGDIDAGANKVLKQELKENWNGKIYEKPFAKAFGLTSEYIYKPANLDEPTISAKTSFQDRRMRIKSRIIEVDEFTGEVVVTIGERFWKSPTEVRWVSF